MGFLDRFTKDASTPDAFTIEIAARIRALAGVSHVETIDADTVEVTWTGRSEPDEIAIGEIRPGWKQAKGFDRIEIVDQFIAGLAPSDAGTTIPGTTIPGASIAGTTAPDVSSPSGAARWAAARLDVLPLLRRTKTDEYGLATWPVTELLEATAIGVDHSAPITQVQCDDWGITAGDVRAAATDNLAAVDPAPDEIGAGIRAWVPTAPDGQQSSWLTAPATLLERLGLVTGIAIAPLVGELVVVDPDDEDLVAAILDNTLTIIQGKSDMLCPVPFLVAGDRVEIWEPAAGHPAAELVHRTHDLFPHH
ncbi:MAG: hypothetical protein ACSLFO_04215 [Acidimicrobiales bacterium]